MGTAQAVTQTKYSDDTLRLTQAFMDTFTAPMDLTAERFDEWAESQGCYTAHPMTSDEQILTATKRNLLRQRIERRGWGRPWSTAAFGAGLAVDLDPVLVAAFNRPRRADFQATHAVLQRQAFAAVVDQLRLGYLGLRVAASPAAQRTAL